MSAPKLIKPAAGARVRKPDGSLLAADGERLAVDSYWIRRLQAGDVVEVAEPAKKGSK